MPGGLTSTARIARTIPPDKPLHETVYERGAHAAVLHYDLMEQY